jgi:histidinol-phosphate/aromatic aminotransferase/cobyric acid decarboxylase-like protein
MGFRDYYRQFEEMAPDEISEELLARRDERRRRTLSRIDPLDLSGTDWHEPPHPDAVNAATFALRRAVNTYPDRSAVALREVLAARHGVAVEQVAVGHGAGELLRGAIAAVVRRGGGAGGTAAHSSGASGGDVLVGWPGWQPLPGLVEAAGGRALPVAPTPAEIVARAGTGTRAVLVTSPADPTGAVLSRGALRELCARVPAEVTVVVDEALGEFAPDGEDAAPLVAELPTLVVVRSFSKAHAMAGLRAGAVLGPPELVASLAPSGGISAPAQAAAAWAVSDAGVAVAARRRAAAAAAHERLAAALAGSPLSAAPGAVPFAWISSSAEDGAAIAARLAQAQVFVAPGSLWGDERHVRASLRGAAAVDRLAQALASAAP